LILPKAILFYPTKSARGCGCIPSSYGTDRINNLDQSSLQMRLFVNENAAKAIASGASARTPLVELSALPQTPQLM